MDARSDEEKIDDGSPADEPVVSGQPEISDVIAGRYRIIKMIAEGGMGIVYQVEHITLTKKFALKLLRPQSKADAATVARFEYEARATSILNHPNIVSVVDFGVVHSAWPYLVMELIDGISLAELLRKKRILTVPDALTVFIQVASAMAYAHGQGIIHRDLKPSNIMLCNADSGEKMGAKVLDFGISKVISIDSVEAQELTRSGEIFGSPLYMSPEQGRGEKIDARADIYSFGCALYECLTGYPPFTGENALTTLLLHQQQTPLTLKEASLGGQFPEELETLIKHLLEKRPQDRYQSMHAVESDLRRIQSGLPLLQDKTVVLRKAKSNLLNEKYIAVSCITVALIGLFFVLLNFYPSAQVASVAPSPDAESTSSVESQQTKREARDTMLMEPFAAVPLQECKSGPWHLQFPADTSLGSISLDIKMGLRESPQWEGKKAQGAVTFSHAHSLLLNPSSEMCERPAYFRLFRPDEISNLHLDSNISLSDDTLLFVDHLTGLRTLELYNTEITDHGLQHIEKLPNITDLNVSNTAGVTGRGLAKLRSLQNLEMLDACRIGDCRALLTALKGSKSLRKLVVAHDDLTDQDMKLIATCKNLSNLSVAKNDAITDAGISELAKLPRLKQLSVVGCSITDASLKMLSKMDLKCLTVDRKLLRTPLAFRELQAAMKGCAVFVE
jgi:serine/threonine protein kinase